MTRALSWLSLGLMLASCSTTSTEALTQIMVVVRSDITELDSVEIRVDGMGDPKTAKASLAKDKLPRTLAVVHRGGPLGPITITARGLVAGEQRVSRSATLSFARGRNVALVLELSSACEDVTCSAKGNTCIDGACGSNAVDVDDLPKWPGSVGKLDLGDADAGDGEGGVPMDAGGDAQTGQDAQADGSDVRDASLEAGPMCEDDEADCDDDGKCESLRTLDDCGKCGRTCEFDGDVAEPNATLSCATGKCLATCESGFGDLDQVRSNGCELPLFVTAPSHVDPTNADVLAKLAGAVVVTCAVTLDFGSGALAEDVDVCGVNVHPLLVAQPGGVDLVVIPLRGLTVQAGQSITLLGARPVVWLVYGDANIAGTISASANGAKPGAGGNTGCVTGTGGNGGSGAGGGGFGTVGGAGGESYSGTGGGAAGGQDGSADLALLRGGCAGGTGAGSSAGGVGGGGGGAVQVSVAGTLTVSGTIAAAGGGGRAPATSNQTGAGGGGSGGAVLVEAAVLVTEASAWITANGGSGGEGSSGAGVGHVGANGSEISGVAVVGSSGTDNGGNGGAGAATSNAGVAAPGADGGSGLLGANPGGGGGGGGGLGRILLRGDACTLAGTTSPAPGVVDCP